MKKYFLLVLFCLIAGCDNASVSNESAGDPSAAGAVTKDVRGEEVSYQVGDQNFNGYLVYDAAIDNPRPGIIIAHEWWGHTEYVRTRAHMLANLGYTALALDMYGDGKTAEHPDDAQKFMNEAMGDAEQMRQRFTAALDVLKQHDSVDQNQIAAIGYCMGGAVVLNMARAGLDLDGVASFHGSLGTSTPAEAGQVSAKILVLHGADDPFVPPDQVEQFKQEMEQAKVDYEFIAYPGAVHAFTNPGATELGNEFGLPLGYNEQADTESWETFKKFLDDIFSQ